MKIAVTTLTRDRLAYTQHCFARLREFAGCDYDHYVLDNASEDGTVEWLRAQDDLTVVEMPENIGIAQGLNYLNDLAFDQDDYDVIVHFDNDCELTQPNTLRDLAQLAHEGGAILSPRILGLQNPPQPTREVQINGETILDIPQIGGICLTAPGWWFRFLEYRYPDNLPLWGLDDAHICHAWREAGGTCGYVKRLEAWHYEGTNGQRDRYPDYFARKDAEYAQVTA